MNKDIIKECWEKQESLVITSDNIYSCEIEPLNTDWNDYIFKAKNYSSYIEFVRSIYTNVCNELRQLNLNVYNEFPESEKSRANTLIELYNYTYLEQIE